VPQNRTKILLTCPVCKTEYMKVEYEHRRNLAKGQASLCTRRCHATWMNWSPAKRAQTRAMLAERNANQWREDNPNWKGGVSAKLKPLPKKEAARGRPRDR
jgi:hypothetical protein